MLFRSPRLLHVQEAIRAEQHRLLGGELATLALGALRSILRDGLARNSDRIAAAKVVLDRAGLGPSKPVEPVKEAKPLSEYTISELEEMVRRQEQALLDVTPAPASAPAPAERPGWGEPSTA